MRTLSMLRLGAGLILILSFLGPACAGNLSGTTSSYLKDHARDAIAWYPWGKRALDRARKNDKLIFLSIGYASCHWCHRLARDTFSNDRIAEALNANFVSILVDREERPDVDGHFMTIMQAMTGHRGWPANFVLTPDQVPLFAVGYITPSPEHGSPGLIEVLRSLAKEWKENGTALLKDVEVTRRQVRDLHKAQPKGRLSDGSDPRAKATKAWAGAFDETYGGFGRSSKFLFPNVLSFLLDQGVRLQDRALLENVYKTLDHMAAGGVRDQLRGAFHRYATDRFWQVPHFEIMLSDNALLAQLYLKAYQASKNPFYAEVAREILDDLLNRFRLPSGGFASSLDSESEGKDGLYYTWTADEVRSVLGPEQAEPFIKAYVDGEHGLIEGRSVLRVVDGPQSQRDLRRKFAGSLSRLRQERAAQTPPKRDDKVLTSWNALAVSAFAKAAQVLGDQRYREVAQETLAYLMANGADAGGLSHNSAEGADSADVFLDDYAFLIEALLDVYETDFDVRHLDGARRLMTALIERFQEKEGRAFQFTPTDSPSSVLAQVQLNEDGAPSGNAAALVALNRLALFGANANLAREASAIPQGLGRYLETSASSAAGLLSVLSFSAEEANEIVIVGRLSDPDTQQLLQEVYSRPLRGTVQSVIPPGAPKENAQWPLLAGRPLLSDKATAYVCRNRLCDFPIDTPAQLAQRLDSLLHP